MLRIDFTARTANILVMSSAQEIAPAFAAPLRSLFSSSSRHLSNPQVQVYQSKRGLYSRHMSSLSCRPLPTPLKTPAAAKKLKYGFSKFDHRTTLQAGNSAGQ